MKDNIGHSDGTEGSVSDEIDDGDEDNDNDDDCNNENNDGTQMVDYDQYEHLYV